MKIEQVYNDKPRKFKPKHVKITIESEDEAAVITKLLERVKPNTYWQNQFKEGLIKILKGL